uniref:Uncharacterized protein n=1 Tax=Arundo donax TaxID=35708 RepID=A0A0A9BWM2_ARUDO
MRRPDPYHLSPYPNQDTARHQGGDGPALAPTSRFQCDASLRGLRPTIFFRFSSP